MFRGVDWKRVCGGKETCRHLGERALRWMKLCEILIWWPAEMPARTRN